MKRDVPVVLIRVLPVIYNSAGETRRALYPGSGEWRLQRQSGQPVHVGAESQVPRKRRIGGVVPHDIAGNDLIEPAEASPEHSGVRPEHAPGETNPRLEIGPGALRQRARPSHLVARLEIEDALEILDKTSERPPIASGARRRFVQIVLSQNDYLIFLVPVGDPVR